MLVPAIKVVVFIVVMLPLWMLDNSGVVDLGRELNGFFVPNATGYSLAAATFWLLVFLAVRLGWRQR